MTELQHRSEALWRFGPMMGIAAAIAVAPTLGADDGPVLCFSRRHTGIACPGCGLSRAMAGLVRGNVNEAVVANPVAILMAAQALIIAVLFTFAPAHQRARIATHAIAPFLVLDAIALITVWVVRYNAGTLPVI